MIAPTLKILYGPPGTGKTWHATRMAVQLIEPNAKDDELLVRHKILVEAGQILWVTFHPSFSYEDFIEGFRPEASERGIMYAPRPGPFMSACYSVTLSSPAGQVFYVGQVITSSSGGEYEVTSASFDSVMVKNLKGKGIGKSTPVSLHVVDILRNAGFSAGELSLGGDKHEAQKRIAERVGIDKQTLFGTSGPLRAVWEYIEKEAPRSTARRPVVLVIDEINRADLSRVFGDIITLLETNKRIGAEEEKKIILPYSKTEFGVPRELHIIGTMNTADKSLSVMDLALRRRFTFIEVLPNPARCASLSNDLRMGEILAGWNRCIAALGGKEKQIGHAYFEKARLEELRVQYSLPNDEDGSLRLIAFVIRETILPLLLDMFRGDWQKVDLVFGRNYDTGAGGLLKEMKDASLQVRAGDQIDFGELSTFDVPNWWNPISDEWVGVKFKSALLAVN